jgi:predicted metal-dependent hydrolase
VPEPAERANNPSLQTPDPQRAGDPLRYEIRLSPRRRTLSIEVHPDLRIIVRAPARCAPAVISAQVAERARWIKRQLEKFRQRGQTAGADQGRRTQAPFDPGERSRAQDVFSQILAVRFDPFRLRGHACPSLKIRKMKTRWGSLAGGRRMTLNLWLIRAPRECIEYVIVHELCHLEHAGHGPRFYRLMDELMPDWCARRRQLEQTLGN